MSSNLYFIEVKISNLTKGHKKVTAHILAKNEYEAMGYFMLYVFKDYEDKWYLNKVEQITLLVKNISENNI